MEGLHVDCVEVSLNHARRVLRGRGALRRRAAAPGWRAGECHRAALKFLNALGAAFHVERPAFDQKRIAPLYLAQKAQKQGFSRFHLPPHQPMAMGCAGLRSGRSFCAVFTRRTS